MKARSILGILGTLLVGLFPTDLYGQPVYFQDFETRPGSEWSHYKVDISPVGNRRFLGQFGNDSVTLTLTNLPSHSRITVTLDLYVINSWDGNDVLWGPDTWELSVLNGPTLLRTTFATHNFSNDRFQSFPENYPTGIFPMMTGASEVGTLGFGWYRGGELEMLDGRFDAVYRLKYEFAHSGGTVSLRFTGSNLQEVADESWGLDNVGVFLGRPPSNFSPLYVGVPKDQIAVEGGTVAFSTSVVGDPPINYAWYFDSEAKIGENSPTLIISNVTQQHEGDYRVYVSNLNPSNGHAPARLTVLAPSAGPNAWVQWPSSKGGNDHYYLRTTVPYVDWRKAEAEAQSYPGGHLVSINSAAEQRFLEAVFLASPFTTTNAYWTGLNDIQTEGVYQWSSGEPLTYTNWELGEPNNASFGTFDEDVMAMNWHRSRTLGTHHYPGTWNDLPVVAVTNASVEPYFGIIETAIFISAAIQPTNLVIAAGGSGILTAIGNGPAPIGYQWQQNGSIIPGATNGTLVIFDAGQKDSGSFRVVISNAGVLAASQPVPVTVFTVPPTIVIQPVGGSVQQGSDFILSVVATGAPPPSFQWQFNGANLLGENGSKLVLRDVGLGDAGPYKVLVSNAVGVITSQAANLGVSPSIAHNAAVETPTLRWVSGGNSPWFVQTAVTHDGVDAVASGTVTDGQSSWLETAVTGPGTLSFWWRVSSEVGFDALRLMVSGVEQARIAGQVDWQQRSVQIPTGLHALRWEYSKDGSSSAGQDRGWLDQVAFVPTAGVSQPFYLGSRKRVLGGKFELFVIGENGKTFRVESSTNGINWTLLTTVTNETGTVQFQDSNAGASPFRFYRALR